MQVANSQNYKSSIQEKKLHIYANLNEKSIQETKIKNKNNTMLFTLYVLILYFIFSWFDISHLNESIATKRRIGHTMPIRNTNDKTTISSRMLFVALFNISPSYLKATKSNDQNSYFYIFYIYNYHHKMPKWRAVP